mmetsp:Transcript_14382/g.21412  ORF Transcript_14382/g.21412 Transcript_14382/m.21412 type:complete len:455 (+) Transcript_14382:223-1587(+)
MSQMNAADLKVVKAIPGNDKCCDCGMKHPQWASVSFGNVFCLECSGVHRSLGVHISFVRSIAMDAWTPAQMKIMRAGGNDKCNNYLKAKGINVSGGSSSIRQKYDTDAAALYKEVLKARADGKPEPTELVKKVKKPYVPLNQRGMSGMGSGGGGGGISAQASSPSAGASGGSNDPNGMEKLRGETDEQYIARQTRLREEARKRMAAKFGNGGMGGGGGGMGGKRVMGGVGSTPHPSQSGASFNMDSLSGTLSSGLGTAASGFSSAFSFAKDTVNSQSTKNVVNDVSSMGMGLWSSISSATKDVATSLNVDASGLGLGDDDDDGLSSLQQQMQRERSARSNGVQYSGFGSDRIGNSTNMNANMNMNEGSIRSASNQSSAPSSGNGRLGGNNDPNSVAPLDGESNEQYIARQTRIRDQAKAKLAAGTRAAVGPQAVPKKAAAKLKVDADDDFFANF